MRNGKILALLTLIGVCAFAVALLIGYAKTSETVRSVVLYKEDVTSDVVESIPDAPVPLAAPRAPETPVETVVMISTMEAVDGSAIEQVIPLIPVKAEPISSEPVTPASKDPAAEEPAAEEPALESPTAPEATEPETPVEEPEDSEDPETPETSAKAIKPSDITNVTAMAKYLFDAATEFWAVEKDFSGTTTRPVSTRVAASISSGTAVDCPGGDTVRVDKNGVSHDSYAIADHFREYVDMPDLEYFKIYLSDKDYTVNPYGAREEVTGTYYQYGSQRATYEPEVEVEAPVEAEVVSTPPAA